MKHKARNAGLVVVGVVIVAGVCQENRVTAVDVHAASSGYSEEDMKLAASVGIPAMPDLLRCMAGC